MPFSLTPFELTLSFFCRTWTNLIKIELKFFLLVIWIEAFYTLFNSDFAESTNVEATNRNFEIEATVDSLQPFSLQQ